MPSTKRIASRVENFKKDGTFQSMYAAQRWLKENGYEYGSRIEQLESGITAYGLLEKYKDRPFINTDTSKHINQ